MKKDTIGLVALILLIIGGLNWGLVGLADLNVVTSLLGQMPILVTIVYDLVGLSALYVIYATWLKK